MSETFNRGTGLIVIEVRASNPNGDPDAEGEPRTTGANRRGLISPVSFKRKLRDLVADAEGPAFQAASTALGLDRGHNRFGILEARHRKREEITRMGPETFIPAYWDARVFGNTFLESMKGKDVPKGPARDHFISTGAVQFGPGISVSPIDIEYGTLTNKAGVEDDKDRGMAPLAWRFVPHAIYVMPFFVNPLGPQKRLHRRGHRADEVYDPARLPRHRLGRAAGRRDSARLVCGAPQPPRLMPRLADRGCAHARKDRRSRSSLYIPRRLPRAVRSRSVGGGAWPSPVRRGPVPQGVGRPRPGMSPAPLAHSAPDPSRAPQDYAAHILAVAAGARRRAEAMLRFAPPRSARLADTVETAGRFHDLGKLDPEVQRGLRSGRGARLDWDHIDAGVAHLAASGAEMAAWLVRAHHAPGLPARGKHFDPDGFGPRLRGRRADFDPGDLDAAERNTAQIRRTDTLLPQMLGTHAAAVGGIAPAKSKMVHGLPLRLCLSCLVDADHEDTARFDADLPPEPAREEPSPRWDERLRALDAYVANLPPSGNAERDRQRGAFYAACRDAPTDAPLVACEGPVGIGKTTAVPAHLLRVAQARGLRRIVVVAPFTNVISQTADILRQALTLPGEDAEAVVVEHHHRADFTSRAARDLAVLWQVPVVVTTAVQFFETLAACGPGALRKLHALPGSAIFLDEAHAALPAHLWPQNWRWLKQLTRNWSCHVVLASGSLARFWENPDVIDPPEPPLPELLPATLRHDVLTSERRRVRYASLGRISSVGELIETVVAKPGPRLVILNTVQSAAVVAREMRAEGHDVLHLSTALAPKDRGPILDLVKLKLRSGLSDWSLVATSCVEAGVDLSFQSRLQGTLLRHQPDPDRGTNKSQRHVRNRRSIRLSAGWNGNHRASRREKLRSNSS